MERSFNWGLSSVVSTRVNTVEKSAKSGSGKSGGWTKRALGHVLGHVIPDFQSILPGSSDKFDVCLFDKAFRSV